MNAQAGSKQPPSKNAERGLRSRILIIDAAAELIREKGVQATSISDITKLSGASAGSIYHHFASKEAIVVEVTHQVIRYPLGALAAYRDNPTGPAELFTFATQALQANPELGDLLVQLGAGATTDGELGRHLRDEFTPLAEAVQEDLHNWALVNDLPPEMVQGRGQILFGLLLGFVAQRRLVGSFDADAYLRQSLQLLNVEHDPSPKP